jgi:hypothetical protein
MPPARSSTRAAPSAVLESRCASDPSVLSMISTAPARSDDRGRTTAGRLNYAGSLPWMETAATSARKKHIRRISGRPRFRTI